MRVFAKILALVFLVTAPISAGNAADMPMLGGTDRHEQHRRAVAEIARLGGSVEVKKAKDGHEYIMITTNGRWRGGDEGLIHLKSLNHLEKLRLGGEITDAGLAHLADLHNLRSLDLHLMTITDAGLAYLKGLTKLERLNLTYAPIMDAGLVHLERLINLKWLGLIYTKVTAAGIAKLKRALPQVLVQSSYVE